MLFRSDAMARLQALVDAAATPPTLRRATRPTRASVRRRLNDKAKHSATKAGRRGGD